MVGGDMGHYLSIALGRPNERGVLVCLYEVYEWVSMCCKWSYMT